MSQPGTVRPERGDVVIIADDEEAPAIFNTLNGEVFITNRVGRFVIECADGSQDLAQIVEQVRDRFKGTGSESVREEVAAFLEAAVEKGLVIWAEDDDQDGEQEAATDLAEGP